MVAHILRRCVTRVFGAVLGLVLIGLVSLREDGLFAQTPPGDFQHDQSEGERFTLQEEDLMDEGELSKRELEERELTPEGSEETEDFEQATVPILPEDFSTPESLHFPERLPDEEPLEEPLLMSSTPPTFPAANTLPPHEQFALYCVESGVGSLSQDEFEQAQEYFERALEIAPLQPFGYYFLGRLAFARGDHKTALVFLHKTDALLVRGDQAWRGEAARLRGAVYEDMQDYRRAYAAYRKSLQLTPTNLRAASALARLGDEELDVSATASR